MAQALTTFRRDSIDGEHPKAVPSTLRRLPAHAEALREVDVAPALGRGAAAAIAGAAEDVSSTIRHRLDELALMWADLDREAAEFVSHMSARAETLQAEVEAYARQCAEVQQYVIHAGKRVFDHGQ